MAPHTQLDPTSFLSDALVILGAAGRLLAAAERLDSLAERVLNPSGPSAQAG